MAVGFIIPLKSRKVAQDWKITSHLLEQTIYSLNNQTCKDFYAVIVGHESPDLSPTAQDAVKFLASPFAIPPLKKSGNYRYHRDFDRILDKYRKIALGLSELRQEKLSYVMVLDADDLLHKDLVSYVLQKMNPNGYIIRCGYQYYSKIKRIIARTDLDKICGSTTIIHTSHVPFPEEVTADTISQIPWCYLSHADMEAHFRKHKRPLQLLPFNGLMYVVQHGQNASDEFRESPKSKLKEFLKPVLLGKQITNQEIEDFGIKAAIDRSQLKTLL